MLTLIDMYEQIINKERIKFTQGTWENGGLDNFHRCLRYLVFEKLKYDRNEFVNEMSFQFLKKWRLATPAQIFYNYHTLNIVNDVFPEWEIKAWELRAVPPTYWDENTIKEAIRFFIVEELKWSREDLVENFNSGMIKETRYNEAMVQFRKQELYKATGRMRSSAFSLLIYCFPEYHLKIWEFTGGTMEHWSEEDIKSALHWLFKEKLIWTDDQIKTGTTKRVFEENGLSQFYHYFFRGSPFKVLNFLYPNEDWEHLKKNDKKNFKNKPDYSFTFFQSN
jgi:hypothetical protein